MLRRSAALIVCLVALVVMACGSAYALRYSITDLGVGSTGDQVYALDINNNGQIVGFTHPRSGSEVAYLWQNGAPQPLSTLSGNAEAKSINDDGTIAGSSCISTYSWRPCVWENGQIRQLPMPTSALYAEAGTINNHGQIVGYYSSNSGIPSPCIWENGVVRNLASTTLTGYGSDINDSGCAVGGTTVSSSSAFVVQNVQNGVVQLIASLGGIRSEAIRVSATGTVVGHSQNAAGEWHACTWNGANPADLGIPTGFISSMALGVNAGGDIVGAAGTTYYPWATALLWSGGTMYSLNDLIPAGSGWSLRAAEDINNSGWIVGTGWHNGKPAAFLLTPIVPEPTSLLALLAGLGGLGAMLRKRRRG